MARSIIRLLIRVLFSVIRLPHMIAATVYIFWGYDWLNYIDFLVKLSMSKINIVMYGL